MLPAASPIRPIRSIVFWYNNPTVHQSGLIAALADTGKFDVTLVTGYDMDPIHRQMGWSEPDFGLAKRVRTADPAAQTEVISTHAGREALHVFSGMRAFPSVYRAMRAVMCTRARTAVMSIRPDPRGIKGRVRRLTYGADAFRFAHHLDLFLALGENGADWYKRVGFPRERVYTFANFTPPPPHTAAHVATGQPFTIAFVGSLLQLKGLDALLHAMHLLPDQRCRLLIIGDGPARTEFESLAGSLGLGNRLEWRGYRPHDEIYTALQESDLFVLPSYYDGWGSVINEALVSGVPVVCTRECGAATVVEASGHGAVVPAGDVKALSLAIEAQQALGKLSWDVRHALAEWAVCLTPAAGVQYFESILAHAFSGLERPEPPWKTGSASATGGVQ